MAEVRVVRVGLQGPAGSGGTVEVQDEGTVIVPTGSALNFVEGANVTIAVTQTPAGTARVEISATGGGGGSAHTIKEAGAALTARTGLNFGAGFDLADDAGNDETDVALDLSEYTGSPLTVPGGGTGFATALANGVLYGNGTSAVQVTAAGAANQVLRIPSGGGAPAFGPLNLDSSSAVVNTLGITFGGTDGATATAGFNNLAPTTTRGDLITRDATNNVRLAVGAVGTILRSDGTDPGWVSLSTAGVQPLDTDLTAIAGLTVAVGDLLLGGAGPAWTNLPIGSNTFVLTSNGTTASWQSPGGLDADLSAIAALTVNVGDLLIGGAGPTWTDLPIGSNTFVLTSDGTTASWQAPGAGSGHTIREAGVDQTARAALNFLTGFELTDDAGNNETEISLDADLVDLASQWGRASGALQAKLHFHEDTDNGTNRIRLMGPALVTADVDVLLPDAAGTLLIDANIGTTVQAWDTNLDQVAAVTVNVGDLLIGGAGPAWTDLAIGGSGTLLRSDGTTAAWASLATAGIQAADADLAAIAALTPNVGDLLVGIAGPTWGDLAIGAAGAILTSDGTTATWEAPTEIDDLPEGDRTDGTELVPIYQSGGAVAVPIDEFIAGPCDVASGPRGSRYRMWDDFDANTAANVATSATHYGNQRTVALFDPVGATTGVGNQASVTDLLAGHAVYGVGTLTTGASATGRVALTGLHAYYVFDQADELRYACRIRIPTVSTTGVQQFIVRVGITTENTGITPTGGGFYVEANTATNWQCYNDDDTTRTAGDSGIAVSNAAYVNIGIHYDGATCHFWMSTGSADMTEVVTQSTNRPDTGQTGMGPTLAIVKSVGTTARTLNVDGWGVDLPIDRGLTFRL